MQNRWIRFAAALAVAYVLIVLVLYGFVAESCRRSPANALPPECRLTSFGSIAEDLLLHSITPFTLLFRMAAGLLSDAPVVKGALVSSYGLLPAEALVATLIVLFLACFIASTRRENVTTSFIALIITSFLWLFFAETCFAFFSL